MTFEEGGEGLSYIDIEGTAKGATTTKILGRSVLSQFQKKQVSQCGWSRVRK